MILRAIVIGICALTMWSMCTEPPPDQLTYNQRQLADSLAKIEMRQAGDSLDSLCRVHFEEYVKIAYDSILNNRKEEIKRLMK